MAKVELHSIFLSVVVGLGLGLSPDATLGAKHKKFVFKTLDMFDICQLICSGCFK